MVLSVDKSEIAFFDVETSVPRRPGQGFAILEFGAILVCPRKLIELESYSTLVRPSDLSLISNLSVRCNGITREAVVSAPTFAEIADKVFDILHGRIWAGHNILKFDCARIREAFAQINRPVPEPKGTIDSLALLTQRFGRRAGNMKMATLATYFGLGQQTHRSLDDVRMNLEVVKYCATVLFLESSLPDLFTENSWVSPNSVTRSRSNGITSPEGVGLDVNKPSSSSKFENHVMSSSPIGPIDMRQLSEEMGGETILSLDSMEEEESCPASQASSLSTAADAASNCINFLEPNEISVSSISADLVCFYRGTQKIQILHKGVPLHLCCRRLKVRFGINSNFRNSAGLPRWSFVVNALPNLCQILDASDNHAQKLAIDSGSSSEWRPVVTRKPGFLNLPTVRLHLTIADGDMSRQGTEIYREESSGTQSQRVVFSTSDTVELDSLFRPGDLVDAYFSLDTYDYQKNAGIRLVARKLIILSN